MSILIGWCVILLLAIPLGGLAAWHMASKAAAVSWPRANAEIVDSDLYRTGRSALWCVKLHVRYQVGARHYESRRISSSRVAGAGCDRDKHVMEAWLERMRPGERITVRYDPKDPATGVVHASAVLEFIDAFVGMVAVFWLAAGISAIRTGRKQRRHQDVAHAGGGKPALR